MSELSGGDEERIAEVKAWFAAGKKVAQVREQLKALGLNDYHVSFILEEATGQSFVPAKPVIIIDTTQMKMLAIGGALVLLLAVAAWWFFLR